MRVSGGSRAIHLDDAGHSSCFLAVHLRTTGGSRHIAIAADFAYAQGMGFPTSDDIVRMSPPQRLELIAQLWDSLDQHDVPLTAAQAEELDRRLASLDRDRKDAVTWEELKAELARRCP